MGENGGGLMIEIKVPKEIKDYKSKLFFNLSVRQFVCTALALVICVPLYIIGKKHLPEDVISWIVILIAAPLLFTGFFRYNEMNFEEFAKEWLDFNTGIQRRKYEYEPIYMEIRKGYMAEDFEQEKIDRKAQKKLERKQRRKNHGKLNGNKDQSEKE